MSTARTDAFRTLMQAPQAIIVEDEGAVATAVAALLSRFNVLSKVVETAEAALELLNRQDFDIAFVNLKLPGMSGNDLIAWCNQHRREMPCIVITGLELNDILSRCGNIKIFMALQKPIMVDDIEALLLKLNFQVTGGPIHETSRP